MGGWDVRQLERLPLTLADAGSAAFRLQLFSVPFRIFFAYLQTCQASSKGTFSPNDATVFSEMRPVKIHAEAGVCLPCSLKLASSA
jgi:hypothetical protein